MANPFRERLEGSQEKQASNPFRQRLSEEKREQRRPQQGRQVAPTPPPEMMAQEQEERRQRIAESSERSRARSPGNVFEGETSVFEAARESARQAGVDPSRSAPTSARMALALSAPVAETPEQQAEVVRNALGDDVEVRVGPETGELEWKGEDDDNFALVNPPGFDVRDLAQAVPETGTLLAGVGGGVTGLGLGGTTGNPLFAGTTTTLGVGAGEGIATKLRLEQARESGYLPELKDEDITKASLERALEASLWTAGGGVVARGARQILAGQLGASTEVIDALGNTPDIDEAFERARKVQKEVSERTGREVPLTAGQVADSPEMRLAEQRATRQGRGDLPRVDREQQQIQETLERNVLGEPVTPDEKARVAQSFERKAKEDVSALERRVETAITPLEGRTGVSPERAAALARGEIVLGRKRLFEEEFGPRYQEIFQNSEFEQADLLPLNQAAADVRDQRGQSILPSISLTDQRALKEAEKAGLRVDSELTLNSENLLEWRDKLVSETTSLKEVQNALVDIRRELRRPGIADEPQKSSILREVETSLERVRSRAVGPQRSAELEQLDAEYARAASDYNQSFIDEFTTLRADGTPVINSDTAFERVLKSPEEAGSFVDALGRIPTGSEALSQFRRGAVASIIERSTKNGEISDTALRNYLTPARRRALAEVFGSEDIAGEFDNVASAVEALKKRRNQYQAATQVTDRILGESFTSPNKIANEVYAKINDLSPERINTVRTSLPKSERPLFDRALATEIRGELVDSNGRVSPDKIDKFLESQGSRVARSVFGEQYVSGLRTVRDFSRMRQPVSSAREGRTIDETLANNFSSGIGGAEGLQKFLRVPFPPLSTRGRALTATLGQLQEKGQRQLANTLADPERFKDMRRLAATDFYTRNFDKIAARVGLGAVLEFKDIVEGNVAVPETSQQDPSPTSISPTL